MKRLGLPLLALLTVLGLSAWALRITADRFEPVKVVNFPPIQDVSGAVTVPEPVPHSRFVELENVVLSPADRNRPSEWSREGELDASGFTHVVLGMTGDVRGTLGSPASVGAILVPDETGPQQILREEGVAVLSLEVTAELEPGRSHFASESVRLPLGFPRYRVYLWNTSSNSLSVDLYAYLAQ